MVHARKSRIAHRGGFCRHQRYFTVQFQGIFMKIAAFAAVFAAGFTVSGAQAVQTTYYFGGSISNYFDVAVPDVNIGSFFSGSFTFESSAVDQHSSPTIGVYDDTASITATVAGFTYSGANSLGGGVKVKIEASDFFEISSYQGINSGPALGGGVFQPYYLELQLIDNTGTAFASDALPGSSMTLASFADAKMYFSWLQGFNQTGAYGQLSYLSTTAPVPEPGTFGLFGLGLAALVLRLARRAE